MTIEALLEVDPEWDVLRIDPVTFSGSRQDLTSFFFAELSPSWRDGKDHLKRLACTSSSTASCWGHSVSSRWSARPSRRSGGEPHDGG